MFYEVRLKLSAKVRVLEREVEHVLDLPRIWFLPAIKEGDVLEIPTDGLRRVQLRVLERPDKRDRIKCDHP